MSTGCCLIAQAGKVDYFTAPENVKIFGQKTYCGDGVKDLGEACDGSVNGATCASLNIGNSCPPGFYWNGTVSCTVACSLTNDCQCVDGNPAVCTINSCGD